jgi:restriction endonuclease S subunit
MKMNKMYFKIPPVSKQKNMVDKYDLIDKKINDLLNLRTTLQLKANALYNLTLL